MHLTDNDVAKFQTLYLNRFGLKLDRLEARSQLALLVKQMQIIYRPIKRKA